MTEASLRRALEIMTTLNEATVTIHMVRAMAQKALDDDKAGLEETYKQTMMNPKFIPCGVYVKGKPNG